MNLKAIKDRIAALLTDKSSGIQPEFREQLSNIAKNAGQCAEDGTSKNDCFCVNVHGVHPFALVFTDHNTEEVWFSPRKRKEDRMAGPLCLFAGLLSHGSQLLSHFCRVCFRDGLANTKSLVNESSLAVV